MNAFAIQAQWPAHEGGAQGSIDAPFCNLRILIDGRNVTAYTTDSGQDEDHLQVPAYYIAEWIAENWWAMLWEPRKSEEFSDDGDFLSRHSLITAQHGFALPNVEIIPTGDDIHIHASKRQPQYADAQFKCGGDVVARRFVVEDELRAFVNGTIKISDGRDSSPLRDAWNLVSETDEDAAEFCRLVGALGLSPYDSHSRVEDVLDKASLFLDKKQLLDLCLTSTAEDLLRSAYVARKMHDALGKVAEVDLSPLTLLSPVSDVTSGPAYRTGYQAARKLRGYFGINEKDVDGASRVFERLRVDPGSKADLDVNISEFPLTGLLEKHDRCGRLALAQDGRPGRRFAAARATYFLWTNEPDEYRLLTSAVTRDQQASRAFAAELLVPQRYIRNEASGSRLNRDKVLEIADLACVAPEVIRYQATNNGLQLV